MKKRILISTFDMEVGGVERSLISMLENFDYEKFEVDLLLYRHAGDFMDLIPPQVNLLNEIPEYTTFRKSVKEIITEKYFAIGLTRIFSKFKADFLAKKQKLAEPGYIQMQYMWKYALPYLPRFEKEYDVAISYLWPHYFVANKVKAKKKIAWIHTDYSTIETDVQLDLSMWDYFDHIVAVSDACQDSFLVKYPELKNKLMVMENILSEDFIKKMANQKLDHPMFEDERFKIVTVARLSHAKGIDQAVRACKILKERAHESIVWYVVGYGGEEDNIKSLIKELELEDEFILVGKQINPYPFIKAANLYVQPSRYEGKAVTVGEAQILGKQVLVTNYSTSSSQVIDGVNGLICDLSIEGIANKIEEIYLKPELLIKCAPEIVAAGKFKPSMTTLNEILCMSV